MFAFGPGECRRHGTGEEKAQEQALEHVRGCWGWGGAADVGQAGVETQLVVQAAVGNCGLGERPRDPPTNASRSEAARSAWQLPTRLMLALQIPASGWM